MRLSFELPCHSFLLLDNLRQLESGAVHQMNHLSLLAHPLPIEDQASFLNDWPGSLRPKRLEYSGRFLPGFLDRLCFNPLDRDRNKCWIYSHLELWL